MKNDVRVISMNQDALRLYRCIAVHGNVELQTAKRSDRDIPEIDNLRQLEDYLAGRIKAEVLSLVQSVCQNTSTRIAKIAEGCEHSDLLEMLAIAYLAKTPLHLYVRCEAGYRLHDICPSGSYSSRQPMKLLYKPDEPHKEASETFDVLLLHMDNWKSCAWNLDNRCGTFDEYAATASNDDKKITFQQLIDDGHSPQEKATENVPATGALFCIDGYTAFS
jgi:hypothetical protein